MAVKIRLKRMGKIRTPYYRVVELYFDSEEEYQASKAMPEGRAPGEDVPNYATGGATVLIAVVD